MQLDLFKANSTEDVVLDRCVSLIHHSAFGLNDFVKPLITELEYAMSTPLGKIPKRFRDLATRIRENSRWCSRAYQDDSGDTLQAYTGMTLMMSYDQLLRDLVTLAQTRSSWLFPGSGCSQFRLMREFFNELVKQRVPAQSERYL